MRHMLLGGTALAGAALLALPAAAQLEVRVTGSVGFQAGYADVDGDDGSIDGFDFQSESEIIIRADGVADNGLEYGAKVEILTSANDPFGEPGGSSNPGNGDEVSLYVAGNWGKLEFGDFDGAADEMQVFAPTVGIDQFDGDFDDFTDGEPGHFYKVRDSGDATKINYYTPDFSGFRFGIAYAPHGGGDGCGDGEQVCLEGAPPGELEDVVELGISYEGELGAVGLAASAVYVFSESGPGASDISDWAIGAQLAFGDFTVGGNYLHRDTEPDESWGATIGASYAMGSWSIAASYLYNEPASGDDIQVYGAGVSYTIAPGLTAAADIVGFDGDADGFAVVTEIRAAF